MLLEERYISTREVAKVYGVKVSTVTRWIREGKIPAYKLGKFYRMKLSELPKEIR